MDLREQLAMSMRNLYNLKGQCYMNIVDDIGVSDLSLKQIGYLKQINNSNGMTTSQLAETLSLSKPTVTEMVKKFIKLEFVFKQSCVSDGRVFYVKLTDKGQKIVDVDLLTNDYLATRLVTKLAKEDIEDLIRILEKMA